MLGGSERLKAPDKDRANEGNVGRSGIHRQSCHQEGFEMQQGAAGAHQRDLSGRCQLQAHEAREPSRRYPALPSQGTMWRQRRA